MPALFPFKGFNNEVVEKLLESKLATKLDVNRFMTPDYSLTENEGMIKKIRSYTWNGEAEDLERGDGLANYIDAEFVEREYVVKRTQAGIRYYDDDAMTDEAWIDEHLKGLSESMINDWTKKAIAEYSKTINQAVMTNYDLGDFADAISKYSREFENQEGLFFLANIELIPTLQKQLGDYLKYTEGYIRTGAVGEILGVPIYTSKAVPKGLMFLAHKDAVHAFLKKQLFVEQDRDIDTKMNRMIAARYAVIALYDERKCIACGQANAQATTMTTPAAGDLVVAGAAPTGAKVSVFVNEKLAGAPVVAAGNAYSVTLMEALKSGDRVKVVAEVEEYLPGVAVEVVA